MSAVVKTDRVRTWFRRFPGWWTLAVQFLMVGAGALVYFGVRGLTESNADVADRNAESLVDLEHTLGILWEKGLQSAIMGHDALVTAVNWVYIYGHWPVVISTLVYLFVRKPGGYYTLRNALFISGGIGLVIFLLFPVAPPRFGAIDLVDTVTQRSSSYRAFQPPGLTNQYAAMPSLHFGWNLLVGIVLWRTTNSVALKVVAVASPALMASAVVLTGNHYVVDVVAGGVVAMIGLAVAYALPAWRETPEWARVA